MQLSSKEIKIEKSTLNMMLIRILDLEKRNNLTKEKKKSEVVAEIISIIEEEIK